MKHTQRKIIHIIKQGLSKGNAHLFFQISKDQKFNFNSQIRSKHRNDQRGTVILDKSFSHLCRALS